MESGKYLYADRQTEDLGKAFERDAQTIREMWEAGEGISPLDDQVMHLAIFDMIINDYLSAWDQEKSVPNFARNATLQHLRYQESGEVILGFVNQSYVKKMGRKKATDQLAMTASNKVDSALYRAWSPFVMEAWIRRGPTFALLPIYKDLFSNKKKPFKGPDYKAINEGLLRLAVTSQVLREVRDRVLQNAELSDGQKSYLKSMDGLFAEYDGLIWQYESILPEDITENIWHFPTSPNMDFGPKNATKADLISIRFKKGERPGVRLFDVKTKPIQRHQRQIGPVTRLTLDDIGDTYVKDGRMNRHAGHLCDEFLNDYLQVEPNHMFSESDKRVAFVSAMLSIHLPSMAYFLENKDKEVPEDDPEIVKELGNWAIKSSS